MENNILECGCIVLNKDEWDNKKFMWDKKYFFIQNHFVFLHFPINISEKIREAMTKIKSKGYTLSKPTMILDKEIGLFTGELMVEINNPSTQAPDIKVLKNKTVYTSFFEGEFKDLISAISILKKYVMTKENKIPVNIYLWYASCPKCWDKRGKITIIFAEV